MRNYWSTGDSLLRLAELVVADGDAELFRLLRDIIERLVLLHKRRNWSDAQDLRDSIYRFHERLTSRPSPPRRLLSCVPSFFHHVLGVRNEERIHVPLSCADLVMSSMAKIRHALHLEPLVAFA